MKPTRVVMAVVALWMPAGPVSGAPERPPAKLLTAQGEQIPGEYLVVFDRNHPAASRADQVAEQHGAVVRRAWSHAVNGALLVGLTEERARAVANRPDVLWVEANQVVNLDAAQLDPPSWGLDRVDQRAPPLSSAYSFDFDGSGVHVYVIDTGIRDTHEDFGGRASRDFDTFGGNGSDCNGHGTHVAGTVGGATHGVAKQVRLHGVRVLDCFGNGTVAGVIDGVDWVTAKHEKPAVANMSLSGSFSATFNAAIDTSVAAGVVYAVAAGNSADDACTESPSSAVRALTVGSTTASDDRSSFSNFGRCVKLFAPGSAITSAWHTSDSATGTISGTSMASPHVAGAAALLLDEHPGLSPSQVTNVLTDRATCDVVGNRGTGSPDKLLHTLAGSPAGCASTCDVTTLAGAAVVGTEAHGACRSLRGGPSLTVAGGGSLTLEAGAAVALADGFKVESGGRLTVRTCAHSLCQTGTRLSSGCHGCVTALCAIDSFCCGTAWDAQCVSAVGSVCGLTCP